MLVTIGRADLGNDVDAAPEGIEIDDATSTRPAGYLKGRL